MTLFYYINKNLDRIKYDVKIGLISYGILRDMQIYSRYDYYKKLGNSNSKAVLFTADSLGINERRVYYLIKKMESEI